MSTKLKPPIAGRIRAVEKPNANAKEVAVAELRKKLKLPNFKEVVQRGTSDAHYEFHFADRPCIVIGNWNQSRNQQHVRGKLEQARLELPRFKPTVWRIICELIFDATTVIETVTEEEELRSLIVPFVSEYSAINFEQEDKRDLIKYVESRIRRGIFYDGRSGIVYLKAEKLTEHLNQHRMGRKFSQHQVVTLLQRHGFVWSQKGIRCPLDVNKNGFHNFGRFWRSPEGYVVRDEDRSHEPEEVAKHLPYLEA